MSEHACDTLKVKSSDPKNQGEYVLINVEDFDKELHELFGDEKAPEGDKDDKGDKEPAEPSKTAKKLAADNGIDLATVQGTGKDGAITVNDVKKAVADKNAGTQPPPPAPAAMTATDPVFENEDTAAFAAEADLDFSKLVGTGENGMVTMADLEKAIDESE